MIARKHNVHSTCLSIYLGYVDEYLRELGEDSTLALNAAGLGSLEPVLAEQRVSLSVLEKVYARVYENPRLPGFFVALGQRIPLTAHGNLGIAFMVSPNLAEVLDKLQRFIEIAMPAVRIDIQVTGERLVVALNVTASSAAAKAAIVESLVSHIVTSVCSLTNRAVQASSISIQGEESASAPFLKALAQGELLFNAAQTSITYPLCLLDEPVKTANRLNESLLLKQCIQELEKIQSQSGVASRVRELIARNIAEQASATAIARKMSLSERSLRRHLEREGHSFRDLVKQVRFDMACYYLTQTKLPVKDIAALLNYSETASFSQSFRAMAGVAPTVWREGSAS